MSEDRYRLFKAITITIVLIVAALYFRYGYLSPRYRYDRITGEIRTLIKDGTWVKETRADEKN